MDFGNPTTAERARISTMIPPADLKQKRARGQLSCTPCRQGKLKCNRIREPACDQCLKRNRESSCVYQPPPAKAKPQSGVKGRIRQLETMVKDLMVQQNHPGQTTTERSQDPTLPPPLTYDEPTPPSDNDPSPQSDALRSVTYSIDSSVDKPFGKMNISKDEISYVGENHWQTILDSLHDIEQDLGEEDDASGDGDHGGEELDQFGDSTTAANTPASPGLDFILGHTKALSREELLAAVPDKKVTDRLLSRWWQSHDPFKIVIHGPTFQEEYRRFWQNKDAPIMWLGVLFAILGLGEAFDLRNGGLDSAAAMACLERVNKYHSMAASAAVLADYTKPKQYTMECLLLYMVGLRSNNASVNAWLVMGLIVRLAFRMGYHRDSSHYANISPFHAEMRRRVWSIVTMIDVLMSFQLGLPSMVRTASTDTQPPRNLLDRDFGPGTDPLPPGRGEDEVTPSLYTRSKLAIVHIFTQAVELSHATEPPSLDTVLALDRDLERAKDDVPTPLQMPGISNLVTDPANQLMCRFNLDLLYLKCKLVLFRRYMNVPLSQLTQDEQNRGIGAGRESCNRCARQVLQHHHTLHAATQPGGQLEEMKWYMGSISTHDFLLAAAILCMELSQQLDQDRMLRVSKGMNCPTRQAMMNALEESYKIWSTTSHSTEPISVGEEQTGRVYKDGNMHMETEKARKCMARMLAKIRARYPTNTGPVAGEPDKPSEEGDSFADGMGISPEGTRRVTDSDGTPFAGVLPTYQWNSAPDEYQFSPAQEGACPMMERTSNSLSADNNQSTGNINSEVGIVPGSDGNGGVTDGVTNMDWTAWDSEMFGFPEQQEIVWAIQPDVAPLHVQDGSYANPNLQNAPGFNMRNTNYQPGFPNVNQPNTTASPMQNTAYTQSGIQNTQSFNFNNMNLDSGFPNTAAGTNLNFEEMRNYDPSGAQFPPRQSSWNGLNTSANG